MYTGAMLCSVSAHYNPGMDETRFLDNLVKPGCRRSDPNLIQILLICSIRNIWWDLRNISDMDLRNIWWDLTHLSHIQKTENLFLTKICWESSQGKIARRNNSGCTS